MARFTLPVAAYGAQINPQNINIMTTLTAKKILKNGQRVIANSEEIYLARNGDLVYLNGCLERVATTEMLTIACEVSHFEEIGILLAR